MSPRPTIATCTAAYRLRVLPLTTTSRSISATNAGNSADGINSGNAGKTKYQALSNVFDANNWNGFFLCSVVRDGSLNIGSTLYIPTGVNGNISAQADVVGARDWWRDGL